MACIRCGKPTEGSLCPECRAWMESQKNGKSSNNGITNHTNRNTNSGQGQRGNYGPQASQGQRGSYGPQTGQGQGGNYGPQTGQGQRGSYGPQTGQGQGGNYGPQTGQGQGGNYGPQTGQGQGGNYGPQTGRGQGGNYGPQTGRGQGGNYGPGNGPKKAGEKDRKGTGGGRSNHSKLFLILAVVIGILIVGVLIFFLIFGRGKSGDSSSESGTSAAVETESVPESSGGGTTGGTVSEDWNSKKEELDQYIETLGDQMMSNTDRVTEVSIAEGTAIYFDDELVAVTTTSQYAMWEDSETGIIYSAGQVIYVTTEYEANKQDNVYYYYEEGLICEDLADNLKGVSEISQEDVDSINLYRTFAQNLYEKYKDSSSVAESEAETGSEPAATSNYAYLDNASMDMGRCLSVDAYERCDRISGVSFYYPKYMFNTVEIDNDNEVKFSYVNQGTGKTEAYLYVSKQAYTTSHPVSAAQTAHDTYLRQMTTTYFDVVIDSNPNNPHAIVGGYPGSDRSYGQYTLVTYDGQYEYLYEFYYPENDPNTELRESQYLVDCIYRYCSFSGSSRAPRSYQKYLAGDMG